MKIISKYKDYYDYLQGAYGTDHQLIYDRRYDNLTKPDYLKEKETPVKYVFAICNKMFTIYRYQGKAYHTVKEILELDALLVKDKNDKFGILNYWSRKKGKEHLKNVVEILYEEENRETDVNKKLRKPVLIEDYFGKLHAPIPILHNGYYRSRIVQQNATWSFPILLEYGFASIYPAEQIYQDISQFLGWLVDNPPIPDNMTNDEKIHSHGFDLKRSFRHRK